MKKLKHILLLSITASFLVACQGQEAKPQVQDNTPSQSQEESAPVEVASSTEPAKSETTYESHTLFNEEVLDDSPYPQSSALAGATAEELIPAISEFYEANFSQDERANNQQPISKADLEELKTDLMANEQLSQLDLDVDQAMVKLGEEDLYIARIIIPMTYQKAENLVPKHDIQILNDAFVSLADRLMIVAYYDQATNTLTPRHLISNQNSLFFNVEQE